MNSKFMKYALWAITRATLWPVTIILFVVIYFKAVKYNRQLGFAHPYKEAYIDAKRTWNQGIDVEKHFLKTGEGIF